MADIFISYSTKDRKIAETLVKFLEKNGLSCWIAPRDIVPGQDWAASISKAISSSGVFLLIYSRNSSVSEQCGREIAIADTKNNVQLVPYKADNTPLIGSFEYYLSSSQWIIADCAKEDYKFNELLRLVCPSNKNTVEYIETEKIPPSAKKANKLPIIILCMASMGLSLIIPFYITPIVIITAAVSLICSIKENIKAVRSMGIISFAANCLCIFAVFFDIQYFDLSIICALNSLVSATLVFLSRSASAITGNNKGSALNSISSSAEHSHSKPILIVYKNGHPDKKIAIGDRKEIKIGRDKKECSVIYDDGTSGVSSLHCSVSYDVLNNVFLVTDLGSSYGTFKMPGAKRLRSGVQYELKQGDTLCIGDNNNIIVLDLE